MFGLSTSSVDNGNKLSVVYGSRWDLISDYNVFISDLNVSEDLLNTSLISFTTPDVTFQDISEFIAGRWVYTNGRPEMYRFELTFRSYEAFELYKRFQELLKESYGNYPNDAKKTITLTVDGQTIVDTGDALIDSISNISFNQSTENQIAEFTVQFKSRSLNEIIDGIPIQKEVKLTSNF